MLNQGEIDRLNASYEGGAVRALDTRRAQELGLAGQVLRVAEVRQFCPLYGDGDYIPGETRVIFTRPGTGFLYPEDVELYGVC